MLQVNVQVQENLEVEFVFVKTDVVNILKAFYSGAFGRVGRVRLKRTNVTCGFGRRLLLRPLVTNKHMQENIQTRNIYTKEY